jgi:hypothetical protein
MVFPPQILIAAVIVFLATFEKKRCFAAASSQMEVTVHVEASCEAAGLCGLADVHELNEPGHVPAPIPSLAASTTPDAVTSVAQLPASADLTGGSRIMVHELNEPGHVPADLPKAPKPPVPSADTATHDREVEVDF